MDIAIIGDHYVQISEMGRDGRLRNIIRKTDFGSRIRNAQVIGASPESAIDKETVNVETKIKTEDDVDLLESNDIGDGDSDISNEFMGGSRPMRSDTSRRLPPQQLLLVLESGDCVFLFIELQGAGKLVFVSTHYRPFGHRIVQPGYHLSVDPSSRYMAMACPENFFIVHELESPQKMNDAYARHDLLNIIRSSRPRAVQGVIHKMEFLYPHSDDDYHIILLLIVVRNGKSRLVTYEWEAGDALASVFREEKRGQPLPLQHQMPMLIIPLTLHSAFFAISARHIGVCRNALNLPLEFDDFDMDVLEKSRFHHGRGEPLWSAWTRPYRLPTYNTTRDCIYLAREDGVVTFLDINSDNILGASVEIGKFECNIGTAFCSVFDEFNDILIMSGDSGPGTIWQIRPRQPNIQLGKIPNWSPVIDLVTSDEFATVNGLQGATGRKIGDGSRYSEGAFAGQYPAPDRIFGTSGRGVTGAITEFRNGLRADIGLEVDFPTPVKQTWIFAARTDTFDVVYYVLISLVDRSEALCMSLDLAQFNAHDNRVQSFDLESRTLAAAKLSEDVILQVTENCLVFSGPDSSVRLLHTETFQQSSIALIDASVFGDLLAITTFVGSSFEGHLLQLKPDRVVDILESFKLPGDATCLCLSSFMGSPYVSIGLVVDGSPAIFTRHFDGAVAPEKQSSYLSLDQLGLLQGGSSGSLHSASKDYFEPLSSLAMFPRENDRAAIVFGTRTGNLVTLILGKTGVLSSNRKLLGLTGVQVLMVDDPNLGTAILAICDGRMTMHYALDDEQAIFRMAHTVWPFDAADLSKPTPFVNNVTLLSGGLPGRENQTQLVLSSTTQFMLAELESQPGPVQHSLPLSGTPSRLLYSHSLGCLVVAITDIQGRSTLQFIEPDTGEDLSMPCDKDGNAVEYISGLGKTDDQLLSLGEWSFESQGDTWIFLLVCTRRGRFLVISANLLKSHRQQRSKIKYWTRYKKSFSDPVFSAVSQGENVFSCVGSTIYWDKLDLQEKRLATCGTYELSSCATSLRIVNKKILAVTNESSIEIIDFATGGSGEMVLHHADSEERSASHLIEIGSKVSGSGLDTSILLVCDRDATASGLWVPWRQPGKDCSVIFEADLPVSVRKLVRGRTRPSWQPARCETRFGLVPSTPDGAEILGVCLDGSLQHFMLLSLPAWRLLRLVHDLALTSPTLFPFTFETSDLDEYDDYEADPQSGDRTVMHIDGDMLQRCVDERALEELFTDPARAAKLYSALEKLDGDVNLNWEARANAADVVQDSAAIDERTRRSIDLMYTILDYYLQPVL
ncbi:hypothetical protein SEPCBS57363_003074 [Sporothrix epigloea]|uniref:RSE1/DDB1/CPSF1 first beta-propeller domain-containing protein n=1 Tax=Sporothrix epigloea TaxID=1892477 RepID=A0ABP0DJF1_9PEZI